MEFRVFAQQLWKELFLLYLSNSVESLSGLNFLFSYIGFSHEEYTQSKDMS